MSSRNLMSSEFRVAAGLRIGAPVSAQFTCKCGFVSSTDGKHALVCPKIKHRLTRHTDCNVVIIEALKTAGYSSNLEPVGIIRKDGRRPDGLTLTPWSRGRVLAWDFTCISRLANSNLHPGIILGSSVAFEAKAQ